MTLRRTLIGSVLTAAYVATIPAANLAVERFGTVPVWFGHTQAPAGVYAVGAALVLRDLVREAFSRAAVIAAIVAGVVLSFVLASPALAFASAAAFAISESLDFFVYEWQRKRGLVVAMGASNAVGLVADSLAFLLIAFGGLTFLPGQIIGKVWVTLFGITVLAALRWARRPQAVAV